MIDAQEAIDGRVLCVQVKPLFTDVAETFESLVNTTKVPFPYAPHFQLLDAGKLLVVQVEASCEDIATDDVFPIIIKVLFP